MSDAYIPQFHTHGLDNHETQLSDLLHQLIVDCQIAYPELRLDVSYDPTRFNKKVELIQCEDCALDSRSTIKVNIIMGHAFTT